MFKFIRKIIVRRRSIIIPFSELGNRFGMEGLEERKLLSAGHHGGGHVASTILLSQAPAAVVTGLDNLAAADSLATPDPTTKVFLKNVRGVETYTVDITGTGTDTRLTVDQNGNAVTAPTRTTTTYSALATTAPAAATEIAAIVSAEGLTAPASTATVNVVTSADGSVVYSINVGGSGRHGNVVSVDAAGNPVGNETVPFSTLSSAIQAGLSSTLAATDTSSVRVRTVDGVTLYSLTTTTSGTSTTTTVDESGNPASLPSTSSTTFDALTTVVQNELQTLATADGYTGTALATANPGVTVYTEANGAIIYAVTVSATGTNSSGASYTFDVTVASDANGNPTVPPRRGFGEGGFGGGCGGGFVDPGAGNSGTGSAGGSGTGSSARRSFRRR